MEDRAPKPTYSVSLRKGITFMQLQIRSEAENSLFIHVPDQISQKGQPFGQWAKKLLETQSEEPSLKLKSKSF